MIEQNETLSDMELDAPPKISFEELRHLVLKDPKMARNRIDLLKTLYYYSKDTKKHSRIIKALFWALIVPLLQDKDSNKTALFGLRSLNQLIKNENSHGEIIGFGKSNPKNTNQSKLIKTKTDASSMSPTKSEIEHRDLDETENINFSNNPIKIIVKKLKETDSALIMVEASAVINSLARTEQVIHMLMEESDLQQIFRDRYLSCDPQSQENILNTISKACKLSQYRQNFAFDADFIHVLLNQINSVNTKVTLLTLKICRQLAKEELNLERLQSSQLRLSKKLISSFHWLNTRNQEKKNQDSEEKELMLLISREISKIFCYIIKYYDLHKRQIQVMLMNNEGFDMKQVADQEVQQTENEVIQTIVYLGRSSKDLKATLNCATSLANITEILNCNPGVACEDAIDMMIDNLKDSKNIKHHTEASRYFANLSFYKTYRDRLIRKGISNYLLKAIEVHVDDETIKHAAIALANLSSHKDFLKANKDSTISQDHEDKTEKWKVKPLIHLLDKNNTQKSTLIQSSCITLCNMASKPSFHKHFINEPEISTIFNCLQNPIEKGKDNDLTRFMIKLVCNLTKNPVVVPNLLAKGFLDILFELLSYEREKEFFGNVVTAIAYMTGEKQAQEKVIENKILSKILEPLTQVHEVDQKLILIALTSILNNKNELQTEFINAGGLSKLLFFLQQKDKLFYQLSCKCFSLLSEEEKNLNLIIQAECIPTILISCLRTKDIDIESLKEITKIFINMTLQHKLTPDYTETICSVADVGLMVNDLETNIFAVFLLNALSEDQSTHIFIRQSGSQQDNQSMLERVNYLFQNFKKENPGNQDQKEYDRQKKQTLITLISSLYLNLSRNEENRQFLLSHKVFQHLNEMILKSEEQGLSIMQNSTALCYINTVFSKLLKYQEARVNCIQESGYKLFIEILNQESNKHLFLETLDSVKLFLTKKEHLVKFKTITNNILLHKDSQELNVSFLQTLAILSFDKENQKNLKAKQFLDEIESSGVFSYIQDGFQEMSENQSLQTAVVYFDNEKNTNLSNQQIKTELTLAVAIILSNLSNDSEYMKTLLGINQWRLKPQNEEEDQKMDEVQLNITEANFERIFDDKFLAKQPQVKRLQTLLNLLSHDHPYISEQTAILLANISNSPFFRIQYVSDRCVKSLVKMLRFHSNNLNSEINLLAALISVLNISAVGGVVNGIENLQFFNSLQEIIKNEALPLINKSIALLAVSNIYTLSKKVEISDETQEFAFKILEEFNYLIEEKKESKEVVLNLVYASLILFHNIILKKPQKDLIRKLLFMITTLIMDHFQEQQIVNVILEIIVLLTKDRETSILLFGQQKIISYVLIKVKTATIESEADTIKLSALGMSRLTARLDESICDQFLTELRQFDNFEHVINQIKKIATLSHEEGKPAKLHSSEEETLNYLLNLLENITAIKMTRQILDCQVLQGQIVTLFTAALSIKHRLSLINILFNLSFNKCEPQILTREFMKLLYKTYRDDTLTREQQRKIIAIVVAASSVEQNHYAIIKSNFYTQFKRNINDFLSELANNNEELEIFGLVNIALNKKYMLHFYTDLKHIHNIAIKSEKVDFKTKVDLMIETSKFIAKVDNTQNKLIGDEDEEHDQTQVIEESLKALIFTIIKLVTILDDQQLSDSNIADMIKRPGKQVCNNFAMFKYFLTAILDCTANLRTQLQYVIQIDQLMLFLQKILETNYEFNLQEEVQFEDQVLNFSLKMIVCEIFFNLKYHPDLFKQEKMSECLTLLIEYSSQVLHMNIEKKTQIVSSTLRLISSMILQYHQQPNSTQTFIQINAVMFVKEALTLSMDLQSSLNIDALFCLNNLLNIKDIAMMPEFLNGETLNNALLIYFAYKEQIDLDECIITFLYTISKYEEYHQFLKDKFKVIFLLVDQNIANTKSDKSTVLDQCRVKLFSTIHNLTEDEEICKQINFRKFVQVNINWFRICSGQTDHIEELALKSLINICRNSTEILEEFNLKDLFNSIAPLYEKFGSLSKQYTLRLVTILTRMWNQQRLEDHLIEVIAILSEFIACCNSDVEIKLVLINLDKISCFKKLLKNLAESNVCASLINNVAKYLKNNWKNEDQKAQAAQEQLIRFCKKLSNQPQSHTHLVNAGIHEIALNYVQHHHKQIRSSDEEKLKQQLSTIQNVMKIVKHIYEGNITPEQQSNLVEKVGQNEHLIDQADILLKSYNNNDDLAIKIVNIIICFNSICNKLDTEHVRMWVQNFAKRLIESSKPESEKKHARSWHMEKYILIIELLVTKNVDKIDRQLTNDLLEIYSIDTTHFTKTIWYKLLKIMAHLQYIQDVQNAGQLDNILSFIIEAYKRADESLSFLFYIKVVLLFTMKTDNNLLFKSSPQFRKVIDICLVYFEKNLRNREDLLVLEILLYLVDFFRFIMNFSSFHSLLNQTQVIRNLLVLLEIHDEPVIVKTVCGALSEASKITLFYPSLLSEQTLSVILKKIIDPKTQVKSLNLLFEVLKYIMIQTKIPVKYLIATSILKEIEIPDVDWSKKTEDNIVTLLKVVHYNIKLISDLRQTANWEGLTCDAFRYSMLAITSILTKYNCQLVFSNRASFLQVLLDNSQFEYDPQMNLRTLRIVIQSLKNSKEIEITKQDQKESIVQFTLANIFKLRNVLEAKETYAVDLPKDQLFFFENADQQLTKVLAMRISLCLSIKLIYRLTKINKKQVCPMILENPYCCELNKYMTSFLEFKDSKTQTHLRQIVEIYKNCSENQSLHSKMLQNDVVNYLVRVVDKAVNTQLSVEDRRDLVIPVLRTFINLCVTNEFNWHLTKNNALELLNSMRERDDEKIREIAREVCEKVVDHIDDSLLADSDFKILIQQINNQSQQQQIKILQQIENAVCSKQVNLGKVVENKQLAMILRIAVIDEGELSKRIVATLLNILNFIYSNKYLQMRNKPELNYKDSLDVIIGESKFKKPSNNQHRVACTLELEESFQILTQIVSSCDQSKLCEQVLNGVSSLLDVYSQSNFKNSECIVNYVFPLLQNLFAKNIKLKPSINCLTNIIISPLYQTVSEQFDVSQLLSTLIQNQRCLDAEQISFQEIILTLEHICKIIFYQHPRLTKGSENLIHLLLQSQHQEFVKLGVFCLFSISLAIQEKQADINLQFFIDDHVMQTLFKFIRDRRAITQPEQSKNGTQVQLTEVKLDQEVNNVCEHLDLAKTRIVCIQILVILLEHINTLENKSEIKVKLSYKILFQYHFFSYMTVRSKQQINQKEEVHKLSQRDEAKLTARFFASIPVSLLVQQNLPVFKSTQPKSDHEKVQNTESVESYFNALSYVLQFSENAQSIYFTVFAVLSFINNVELKSHDPSKSYNQIQPQLLKIQDMDLSIMFAVLVKTNIIGLVLMQPQKITADEEIIRVCLKFLITIMYKQSHLNILLSQKKSQEVQELFTRLNLPYEDQKKTFQENVRQFIFKLNQFDVSKLYQGGYVHYIHLVSQIVNQAAPQIKEAMLPTQSVLLDLIRQFSSIESMSEAHLSQVVDHVEVKPKKMLIFKFFFFNYLIQLTLPEITQLLLGHQQDLSNLISSLLQILNVLKSKSTNQSFDFAMKPYKQWKQDEEQEDGQSCCLSIVKMTLYNLNNLIKLTTIPFELTVKQLESLSNILVDYEDIGDIVEPTYDFLLKLLQLINNDSRNSTVLVMEQSRVLLSQGIKHATTYQCNQAFFVLNALVTVSEKYKDKPEMHQNLMKIAPANLRSGSNVTVNLNFGQN